MTQNATQGLPAHRLVTNPETPIRLAMVAGARPNFMKIAPLM